MKHFLVAVTISLSALTLDAGAHGPDKAQHGGVVQSASDLTFELVAQPDGAALYVVDHGKAANVSGMTGKLVVLNGTAKTEAELKPAGGNKLEASNVTLEKGSTAVASVSTAAKKNITVRFKMK